MSRVRGGGAVRSYLNGTRDLLTSLVLVLPLFVLYQVGILATGGVRNGVDFVTDALMMLVGNSVQNYLLFQLGVFALFIVAIAGMRSKGTFRPRLFPWMLLESTVYALLFGTVIVLMIQGVGLGGLLAAGAKPSHGMLNSIVLSVGAGLYEELVFRLLLMGGIFWFATRVTRMHRVAAAIGAVFVSSVIFSLVHHVGSLGEPFTVAAFTFRFFAGVLLATIFHTRGFAIAAYTHAIYDVYVLVVRGDG
jgi:membrane protease YdiL (CAAX protease family)